MKTYSLRTIPCSARPMVVAGRALMGTILLLTAAAQPAAAQASRTAQGDLLLPGSEGRHFVQRAGSHQVELPLSKAARVTDFRTAETSWFVAAVAASSNGQSLELLEGTDTRIATLPAPALTQAAMLAQPIFIADRAEIHALVWLEGEAHNQLAVHAARWINGSWGPTEVVAAPGPGTQIALSTAVLDDGSWLIVWAAYDGVDDEILWSRWSNGYWSAQQPVAEDNRVPDITPSLFPTEGGALLAWSRYDGSDYRVNLARFDGTDWSQPTVIGPKGSTSPVFSDGDGDASPYLIYHHADPRAWNVIELDDAGNIQRQAGIEDPRSERPTIAGISQTTVTLEWANAITKTLTAPLLWSE